MSMKEVLKKLNGLKLSDLQACSVKKQHADAAKFIGTLPLDVQAFIKELKQSLPASITHKRSASEDEIAAKMADELMETGGEAFNSVQLADTLLKDLPHEFDIYTPTMLEKLDALNNFLREGETALQVFQLYSAIETKLGQLQQKIEVQKRQLINAQMPAWIAELANAGNMSAVEGLNNLSEKIDQGEITSEESLRYLKESYSFSDDAMLKMVSEETKSLSENLTLIAQLEQECAEYQRLSKGKNLQTIKHLQEILQDKTKLPSIRLQDFHDVFEGSKKKLAGDSEWAKFLTAIEELLNPIIDKLNEKRREGRKLPPVAFSPKRKVVERIDLDQQKKKYA